MVAFREGDAHPAYCACPVCMIEGLMPIFEQIVHLQSAKEKTSNLARILAARPKATAEEAALLLYRSERAYMKLCGAK